MEEFFGTDSIELMINGLTKHLDYIEIMRKHRFWEIKSSSGTHDVINENVRQHSVKFPIYKKGERPVAKLLDWKMYDCRMRWENEWLICSLIKFDWLIVVIKNTWLDR